MLTVPTATLAFAFCDAAAPVLKLTAIVPAAFWNDAPSTDSELSTPSVSASPPPLKSTVTLLTLLASAVLETVAHLQLLELQDRIAQTEVDGVTHYVATPARPAVPA